jgi:hypothetical protein
MHMQIWFNFPFRILKYLFRVLRTAFLLHYTFYNFEIQISKISKSWRLKSRILGISISNNPQISNSLLHRDAVGWQATKTSTRAQDATTSLTPTMTRKTSCTPCASSTSPGTPSCGTKRLSIPLTLSVSRVRSLWLIMRMCRGRAATDPPKRTATRTSLTATKRK